MKASLDHIQLAIPEGGEAACREFWVHLVGLAEIEKPPALRARGGLWLALNGAEIHLGVEAGFAPAKKAHPGISVDAIDALAQRLGDAGLELTWDDAISGRKRFFTQDPFGNRLEFLEG